MASAAVPAMSSGAAPASSGAPGAGAPPAQPGGGAGPVGIAGQIESMLDEGVAQQQRGAQVQARAGETVQQQQSRLEALIRSLPDEERGPAFQELNHLRTQAGRRAAEERQQAEAALETDEPTHEMRIAKALLIRDVRADPSKLHELAAWAGVDPEALAEEAGIQGGAVPGQTNPSRDPRILADPGLMKRAWAEMRARADVGHEQSWTKPLVAIRDAADTHRMNAQRYAAEARIAESAASKADFEALAKQSSESARAMEIKGDMHLLERMQVMMELLSEHFGERLGPFEKLAQAAHAKDQATSQLQGARQAMVNEAATVIAPQGHALFGPQGYGVFVTDSAGNVTGIDQNGGVEMLDAADQVMHEYGLPRNAAGLARALHLLSLEAPKDSDGANRNPAGTRPGGGSSTLPAGAPGSFGQRPSLAGDIMGSLSPRY